MSLRLYFAGPAVQLNVRCTHAAVEPTAYIDSISTQNPTLLESAEFARAPHIQQWSTTALVLITFTQKRRPYECECINCKTAVAGLRPNGESIMSERRSSACARKEALHYMRTMRAQDVVPDRTD